MLEQLGLCFVSNQIPKQLLHLIPLVLLIRVGELLVPLLDSGVVLSQLVASLQDGVDVLEQVALFVNNSSSFEINKR